MAQAILSRSEYEDLLGRAARAESLIKQLQQKVGELNASGGSAKKPVAKPAPEQKSQLKDEIIKCLKVSSPLTTLNLANQLGCTHQDVIGAVSSLAAQEQVLWTKQEEAMQILTEAGETIISEGATPEAKVFNSIPNEGIHRAELAEKFEKKIFNIAFGQLKKRRCVNLDKKSQLITKTNDFEDEALKLLMTIKSGGKIPKKEFKDLKKRTLAQQKLMKFFNVKKGPNFGQSTDVLSTITYEDIKKYTDETGNWTGPQLRKMNLKASVKMPPFGCLHPLMKVRHEFREILLSMGFEEMRTNRYVESSFWNFDTLFQPQAHPARDAHDTFFLANPAYKENPENIAQYFERVKQTHENGWETGSLGWRTEWDPRTAFQNILRTHTTAISARTLYEIAQQRPLKPRKFFSIDRVFRNETIDATHLAEFHQVEGFVIGQGLTLAHLIGTIAEFFKRIGIPEVRFKPAYNPYTEPSMEIFGWSEERQDWMEVGNSGVFRPEMLLPMGLPPDVNVIAWGLGLERPTMIKYKYKNIRDLFGHAVRLDMCQKNPIPRFDKS